MLTQYKPDILQPKPYLPVLLNLYLLVLKLVCACIRITYFIYTFFFLCFFPRSLQTLVESFQEYIYILLLNSNCWGSIEVSTGIVICMWHKAFKSVVIHCLYRPTGNNPETNKQNCDSVKDALDILCDTLRLTHLHKSLYSVVSAYSKQINIRQLRSGILQVRAQASLWVTVVADPELAHVCVHMHMSLPPFS